jgi:hypothetical protein
MPGSLIDMKLFMNAVGEIKEAVELISGGKCHLKNGKLHRLDGPAIEYVDGSGEWWYEGQQVRCCSSQEQFERYLKLRAFW